MERHMISKADIVRRLRLGYLRGDLTAGEAADQLHRAGFSQAVLTDAEALELLGIPESERTLNYSLEEIWAMHDRNESFQGSKADISKLRLYHEIKSKLADFKKRCHLVRRVEGSDPDRREKHAIICLDLNYAARLGKRETAALTAIMNMADGLIICPVGDKVRITFEIRDIWLN